MLRFVTLVCLLLALPVLGILGSWLSLDSHALGVLQHQLSTVLPEYAWASLLLTVSVGVGVALVGMLYMLLLGDPLTQRGAQQQALLRSAEARQQERCRRTAKCAMCHLIQSPSMRRCRTPCPLTYTK